MIPFLKKNKDGKKPPKPTVPRTAQESIPFQRMFEDGTCRVRPGYYTRTIQYQDINYQLAQQEDKTAIFEEWCSFLNFFDSSIFGAVSFLNITASDLSDQLLKDFLDMDSSQIVTMHIQSVDQNKAIKTIKHTITELDRSKIEEQKKAVRAGYDMDVLPSDLATYGRDAKALLKELQSQNERMFLVTFLVLNTGKTEQELETNVFQAVSIAQKHNCELCRLDFQQEQGLMSSLPLADCQIEIQRGLTTSSTAIFVPFTTQELFDNGKESLYYGLNALSNNLIMVDRKKLKNPNGLILGTPGSGKSFSAKREICNAFLVTDDDIIICDPEAEYAPLVERLHGQVIHISPASTQYINPMDINSNYSEEDNPLALKADFVLSLCELVVGGKEGLQPVEKTVIDRCVHVIYRKYFENPTPENAQSGEWRSADPRKAAQHLAPPAFLRHPLR